MQFYEPQAGDIRLCGIHGEDCSLESWRRQIAIVPQNNSLLHISIADNIALGYGSTPHLVDHERIVQAAKLAKVHAFIKELPDGYDTIIGTTAKKMSSGQQQRIALARAFISSAPLVILDEPTSLLDVESEQHIISSIRALSEEKTVLVITHNDTLLTIADTVIYL
jgi:ABC-type bacteriocin/lantibiotic exporter with double-glycine peptidase domain